VCGFDLLHLVLRDTECGGQFLPMAHQFTARAYLHQLINLWWWRRRGCQGGCAGGERVIKS